MKFSTTLIALVVSGAGFVAANPHGGPSSHHARVSRHHVQGINSVKRNSIVKRCKVRPGQTKSVEQANVKKPEPKKEEVKEPVKEVKIQEAPKETKPPKEAPKPPPKNEDVSSGGTLNNGQCGGSRASSKTTSESGPNGSIDFLNCGINEGGWRPPSLKIGDIKTKSLGESLQNPNSPFHACSKYLHLFEQYGGEFGIPPIMLASFAMQESSCNPNTIGGGGEQGLMQITKDKCGGAPGGDCRNPEFNIRTGAKYFADTLDSFGGDILLSLGRYNGWAKGMTYGSATAAAHSSCCRCQNNLDYLHQFLNGWCQGINAYDTRLRLGKYFNLDQCN